jgi:hypothetical protein
MPNNTFEDYKIAVKKKYEIEKNGDHSFYLNSPTRAKLRNLCWELFQQQNRNQDDLNVFSSLLGLAFDVNKKNKFDEQIDKFRPIDNYFKGESDPAIVEAVNMAAILVDFKARPFNKFRIHSLYGDEIEIENGESLEFSSPEMEQRELNVQIDNSGSLEKFLDEKEKEKGREKGVENETVTKRVNNIEVILPRPKGVIEFVDKKKGTWKPPINMKDAIIGASIFLFIGFVIVYFAFPQKDCMQWSGDHYEMVDCNLKIDSYGSFANIEILDPTLVNLKKIKVCDTTACFDKNGVAIIWYAKTANGIDFFDAHGRHPENGSSLRPVTNYILDKYVRHKSSN